MTDLAGANIEAIKAKYEGHLLTLPNVVGVGLGKRGADPVIKVFVQQKVPLNQLQKQAIIPKSLDGVTVDVEEIGAVTVSDDKVERK